MLSLSSESCQRFQCGLIQFFVGLGRTSPTIHANETDHGSLSCCSAHVANLWEYVHFRPDYVGPCLISCPSLQTPQPNMTYAKRALADEASTLWQPPRTSVTLTCPFLSRISNISFYPSTGSGQHLYHVGPTPLPLMTHNTHTPDLAVALAPYATFSLFHVLTFTRTNIIPKIFPTTPQPGQSERAAQHPVAKTLHAWVKGVSREPEDVRMCF